MIAWAGMEMWEAGWESELGITSIARWPMGGGQILGAKGWKKRRKQRWFQENSDLIDTFQGCASR